jgi:hypothetical protein
VEISNEPAVSALGVTTECEGWGQLIVAVGDIHTAEPFPDSLRHNEQRRARRGWIAPFHAESGQFCLREFRLFA